MVAFGYHFVRTLHRPDRHRSWERRRFDFVPLSEGKQAPGIFTVEIAPLKPAYVSRNTCEITDPDGNVWKEAEGAWPERPELMRGSLRAEYPGSFPGAPPLKSGVYQIRWLLGVGRRR